MFKKLTKRLIYFWLHPVLRWYYRALKPKTSGARAVVRYKDEILLIRNIGVAHWSLPGGKIEAGETPEACLERELAEEVAVVNFKLDYKLGLYLSKQEERRDLIHIFVVTAPSFYHKKEWELDEARWFKTDDLPENLSPATRRRLKEYQTGQRGFAGRW